MSRIGIPIRILVRIAHLRKKLRQTERRDYPDSIKLAAKIYGITIR